MTFFYKSECARKCLDHNKNQLMNMMYQYAGGDFEQLIAILEDAARKTSGYMAHLNGQFCLQYTYIDSSSNQPSFDPRTRPMDFVFPSRWVAAEKLQNRCMPLTHYADQNEIVA